MYKIRAWFVSDATPRTMTT